MGSRKRFMQHKGKYNYPGHGDAELIELLLALCKKELDYFSNKDLPLQGTRLKYLTWLVADKNLSLDEEKGNYSLDSNIDRRDYCKFLTWLKDNPVKEYQLFIDLTHELEGCDPDSPEYVGLNCSLSSKESDKSVDKFSIYKPESDKVSDSIQVIFTLPEGALFFEHNNKYSESNRVYFSLDANLDSQTNKRKISIKKSGTHDIGVTIYIEINRGFQIVQQLKYGIEVPKLINPPKAKLSLGLKNGSDLEYKFELNDTTKHSGTEPCKGFDIQAIETILKHNKETWLDTLGEKLASFLPHGLKHSLKHLPENTKLKIYFDDDKAQSYPWECLKVGEHFVLKSVRKTRAANDLDNKFENSFSLANPVIALVDKSNTTYAERAAHEIATLFNTKPISGEQEFADRIKNAGLIHIFGHHDVKNRNTLSPQYYEFEGVRFNILDLPKLQERPLVILANCFTDIFFPNQIITSWSEAFLKKGAGAVIATHFQITDRGAASFAKDFYANFLKGKCLGKSFYQATQTLDENQDKLAYILYSKYQARYKP